MRAVLMLYSCREERYVAVKALKGYSTNLSTRGIMWELDALERVASMLTHSGIESNPC
jgi:hypothetical protein